jgi:hypothetical protein
MALRLEILDADCRDFKYRGKGLNFIIHLCALVDE